MLKARLVGLTGCDGRLGTLLKGSPGDTPISPGPIRPPITPPLQSLLSQIIIHQPVSSANFSLKSGEKPAGASRTAEGHLL